MPIWCTSNSRVVIRIFDFQKLASLVSASPECAISSQFMDIVHGDVELILVVRYRCQPRLTRSSSWSSPVGRSGTEQCSMCAHRRRHSWHLIKEDQTSALYDLWYRSVISLVLDLLVGDTITPGREHSVVKCRPSWEPSTQQHTIRVLGT